jgi:hypothetical protein
MEEANGTASGLATGRFKDMGFGFHITVLIDRIDIYDIYDTSSDEYDVLF